MSSIPTTITIEVQSLAIATLVSISVTFGIGLKVGHEPKELLCRSYLQELKLVRDQFDARNLKTADSIAKAALACEAREQQACDLRIEKMRAEIKELRCRICERAEKLP